MSQELRPEQGNNSPSPQHFSDAVDQITELRVSGGTPPKELASSIIHILNDDRRVCLTAIGHQAVGQAVKAIPAVNQHCVSQGYLVCILPSFKISKVPNREVEDPATTADGDRTIERTVTVLSLVKIYPQ